VTKEAKGWRTRLIDAGIIAVIVLGGIAAVYYVGGIQVIQRRMANTIPMESVDGGR
jgi:hypothetical protein